MLTILLQTTHIQPLRMFHVFYKRLKNPSQSDFEGRLRSSRKERLLNWNEVY